MERTSKVILLAAISIAAVMGLAGVAYAQTNRASATSQCSSMMGGRGMGMMGGNNGMMGQTSNTMNDCQSMMTQSGIAECQNIASQRMQCQGIMN